MNRFCARALPLLIAVILAGCALPGHAPTGRVAGTGVVRARLTHHEHAVPGVVLTAVRNLGIASLEERVVAAGGADGRAVLGLSPGNWYLSAAAIADGRPVFGWYGSNPVTIRPDETVEVVIPAVVADAATAHASVAAGEESVAGEVLGDSGIVAGAGVAMYLDASTQFRGPGYVETVTDASGRFEARVSPGRYWLVARRRSGPQAFGPLEIGDDFGFFPGNPLVVREGERATVRIPAVRVLKKSGWSGPSTLRTRVSGTIRDDSGRPLPGHRAFLHAKATMLGKPDFVSEPSGPDGAFVIWVDREGVYFLGARAEIGRAREEKDVIGRYAGSPDHSITVRLGAGDLPAFDIVVGSPP